MTQVIPREDDFAEGPGARGATLATWVRMRPWDADKAYASGGVEFSSLYFHTGDMRMTDGFSRDLPDDDLASRATTFGAGRGDGRDLLAGSSAAFVEVNESTTWPKLGGAFFRNAVAENLDVLALFGGVWNVDLTQGANDYIRYCGLAARLQDGTNANAGDQDTEVVVDQVGYFFVRATNGSGSPNGSKYYLLRSDGAGSYDRLADYPSGEDVVLDPVALRSGAPQRMRLKVTTNGSGNVEISAWLGQTGDADTPVLTYTDSSGDKITGDGRVGFFASYEQYAATGQNGALVCSWIEATNVTAASLLFRDEFVRNVGLNRQDVPNYGAVAATPAENYTGDSLIMAFYGDLGANTDPHVFTVPTGIPFGQQVFDGDDLLLDYSNMNPGLAGALWAPSQFRAESARTGRLCTFEFLAVGTAGSYNREARIMARESGTLELPWMHYEIAIEIDDIGATTNGTARLRRYLLGTAQELGTATVTIAEATDYEVELRTRNLTGAGLVDGTVEIKGFLDKTQIVFTGTPPAGITVDSAGTFLDQSNRRLTDERGEGFGCAIPSTANGIKLKSWALGIEDVPEVPDVDRVPISVTAEAASPQGTLTIPAGWSVTREEPSAPQIVRHEFEADYVRTEARNTRYRPRWKLRGTVSKNALGTLEAFWDNHKGGQIPFNWTDPQGVAHVAHFVDSFEKSKLSPAAWEFSCTLEALGE